MNSMKYIRNNLETGYFLKYLSDLPLCIKTPLKARMAKAGFASTIFKELERPKSKNSMKSVTDEIDYLEMKCYLILNVNPSYKWLVRNDIQLNLDFKNQLNKISRMRISKNHEISI